MKKEKLSVHNGANDIAFEQCEPSDGDTKVFNLISSQLVNHKRRSRSSVSDDSLKSVLQI